MAAPHTRSRYSGSSVNSATRPSPLLSLHLPACEVVPLGELQGEEQERDALLAWGGRESVAGATVGLRTADLVLDTRGQLCAGPGRSWWRIPAQILGDDGACVAGGRPALGARRGVVDRCRPGADEASSPRPGISGVQTQSFHVAGSGLVDLGGLLQSAFDLGHPGWEPSARLACFA
jgi:hypothetical protein